MVSAPRCSPGARGLLALLLLLPLPGARGQCGALPRLSRASPRDTNRTEGFPIDTEVTYRCLAGFVKIPGKSDTVVCLPNSEWSTFGEFCNGGCGAPPRLKSATLNKEDEQKNYCPPGSTVSYDCRPGYESTEVKPVVTCLENLTWSEAPEFCRGKSCGVPKGPEHGRAVVITNDLYGARANIICDDGFSLHGRPFIQCLPKGDQVEWSQLPTCQGIPCKQLELENGRVHVTDHRVGATANFSCNEGYRLVGPTSAQCVAVGNGVNWDKELPHCQALPCPLPIGITHGSHTGQSEQEFSFGSAVTYRCDQGFSLIGEASIHCTTKDNVNGEWSGPAPECKAIPCPPPPDITHGSHTGQSEQEFSFGSAVTYRCDQGFSLIGEASIDCSTKDNINGEWSGPAPECKAIPCPPPPDITHGSHTGQSEQEFSFGSAVTYRCDQGFSLIGDASIHCTTRDNVNGEWSGPAPECKAIPCPPPPDITHGSHTGQSEQEFSFGSAVTYRCDQGFSLIGDASIHCTTRDNVNGEWSGPAPECKAISCPPPYGITHGSHTGQSEQEFSFGSAVTYRCDQGFSLIGEVSIHCTTKDNVNGEWSGPAPECKAIRCPPPYGITHGSHTGQSEQEFSVGSAVTYRCDQGFSLIGEASIHCTTKDSVTGEWSGPAPECKVIITQDKPTTVPPEGAEVTGIYSDIITQDKPTTVPPKGAEVAGTSSDSALNTAGNSAEPEVEGPGIDRRIGITSIGPGIDTYIIFIIIAVIIVVVIVILIGIGNIGIFAALNKKWKNKKGFYSVNPDSPKHQIATEHDSHMNESKCNLIFKV